MVKSIVIDETANTSLNQLLQAKRDSSESSQTGILIGTIDQSKDYILNVVATPINDAGGNDLDKEWIVDHALQVHDMLVGGMDILGIYCIDFTPAQAKQIVFQLYKSLNKFEYYRQMRFNSDRLVFLVDSSAKTINMKCLDMKGATEASGSEVLKGVTFQPCEIKVQANLLDNEFFRIDSNFNFNTKFKTPNLKSHNLLKEHFYNALSVEEMFDNQKFVCLINDTLVEENCTFSDCLKTLKETEYFAHLMENMSKNGKDVNQNSSSSKTTHQNMDSIYELTGICYLIVQFHKSFQVQQIKRLLVYDLMRSLYARVRLLVEDLDARKEIIGDVQLEDPNSNDVSSIEESYQTPNRIFIYTNEKGKNRMVISDYVFPDETDADISERIKQLFNYDIVDAKNDIVYVEDLPPEIKSSQSENDNNIETSTHSGQMSSNSNHGSNANLNARNNVDSEGRSLFKKSIFYVTASCAAIASFIISYYSYRAANFLNYDDTEFN